MATFRLERKSFGKFQEANKNIISEAKVVGDSAVKNIWKSGAKGKAGLIAGGGLLAAGGLLGAKKALSKKGDA